MPRIPDRVLNSVFYLYETIEDAKKGTDSGGTGFFVAVPSEKFPNRPEGFTVYGVTNWHLAVRDGFSVIRLTTVDGESAYFELDPADWTFDQNGNDIAISPALDIDKTIYSAVALLISMLATKEYISQCDIGVGEDVFMVGRFIDHDGGQINQPAARFGSISIMPSKIEHEGRMRESYCIDMHSRTGYSGSPVFAYRTPGADLKLHFARDENANVPVMQFLSLIGIHWGQFEEYLAISESQPKREAAHIEIVDGKHIKGLSGMTLVCPAWNILELINMEKFKKERAQRDEELTTLLSPTPSIVEESALFNNNPNHQEDFNNLLDAAVKEKQ